MKKSLKHVLDKDLTEKELELIPRSYDIVGDIIIFAEFPKELKKKEKLIAESMLKLHKHINVVCKKIRKYSGKYRLPRLKIIAGEKRKETLYKENNIRLKLDVEKVYFSPRSSNERKRIAQLVKQNEDILVMFSGAAPFPIVISKNSRPKSIIGVEINPTAHKYAEENIKINKISNISLIKGDVKKVLPKLNKRFDRILMPLPKGAESYLKLAISNAKSKATIHFYDFLNEKDFELGKEKVKNACKESKRKCRILDFVKCGQYAPATFRVCVDFRVF